MSLVRRAAKRDQSERAIVHCLRLSGWSWLPLSARDAPDGVLARDWVCLLAEIKTGNKPLREGQERWHSEWRGSRPLVLRDVEDVIALNRLFNLVVSTAPDSVQRVLRASVSWVKDLRDSQRPLKPGRTTHEATPRPNGRKLDTLNPNGKQRRKSL